MELNWHRIAEQRIQEAIDEGKFDNLPGKGQPLNLEEDMSTPPHLRVANRILKNAGVLPDWMQLDNEIDRAREAVLATWNRLVREYPKRKTRATAPAGSVISDPDRRQMDFAKWLAKERCAYIQSMRQFNTDITKLLLIAPSVPRVHHPFRLADETARFDEAFPPLPGVEAPSPPEPERDEVVQETVRALYAARHLRGR